MLITYINGYNLDSGVKLTFDNGEEYTVKPPFRRSGDWYVFTKWLSTRVHLEKVHDIAAELGKTENPREMSLLVARNEDDEVVGRALIWMDALRYLAVEDAAYGEPY